MAREISQYMEGFVASATTHFLRPAPMAPLSVTVRPLRLGQRVSVVDAEVASEDGVVAVQRATLIAARPTNGLPLPPPLAVQPEIWPKRTRAAPHGGAWLMDTLEVRHADDGVIWFKTLTPLFDSSCDLARVLVAADWAHGLVPPLGCEERPEAAIPNTDLSVHLVRAPVGEWIGVDATMAWSTDAIGAGWAMLRDTQGLMGRVAMSIAVTPLVATTA